MAQILEKKIKVVVIDDLLNRKFDCNLYIIKIRYIFRI